MVFGRDFNQSLDNTRLPNGLHTLIFGDGFNQNLDNTSLPPDLQELNFGNAFKQDQSLAKTNLPSGFKHLSFPGGIVYRFGSPPRTKQYAEQNRPELSVSF